MKLIIIIPCFNEAENIAETLGDLPDTIEGIDEIQTLLIDDCSTDDSAKLAKAAGVSEIISIRQQRGLGHVIKTGVDAALARGADIITITDGDNQYNGGDLPKLVRPILSGEADVVVGERPIEQTGSFSPVKKLLQRFGSHIVSSWFGMQVPDVASGFRAFTREAAFCLHQKSKFTISIEALVQWAAQGFFITTVPIRTNEVTRPSRLMKSSMQYVRRQAGIILRLYLEYRPFRFFSIPAGLFSAVGLFFWLRFLYFYFTGSGGGHVQSVVIGSALVITGIVLFITACLAHLSANNRRTLEYIYQEARRRHFETTRESD
jgi:glycosyltransferase involved in cell wall biosynthesis